MTVSIDRARRELASFQSRARRLSRRFHAASTCEVLPLVTHREDRGVKLLTRLSHASTEPVAELSSQTTPERRHLVLRHFRLLL